MISKNKWKSQRIEPNSNSILDLYGRRKSRKPRSDRPEKTDLFNKRASFNEIYTSSFAQRRRSSREKEVKGSLLRKQGGALSGLQASFGHPKKKSRSRIKRERDKLRQSTVPRKGAYLESRDGAAASRYQRLDTDVSLIFKHQRHSSCTQNPREDAARDRPEKLRFSSVFKRKKSEKRKEQSFHKSKRKKSTDPVLRQLSKLYDSSSSIEDPRLSKRKKLLKKMMLLYKTRDYEKAIMEGEEVLQNDPFCLEALHVVGLSSAMIDDHSRTISKLQQLVKLEPTYKKTNFLFLSIAYKKLGALEKAVHTLNVGISHFPGFADAYLYRGKLYLRLDRADLADQDFQQALQLGGDKVASFLGLADSAKVLRQYSKAIQFYTSVLQLKPSMIETIGIKKAQCLVEHNNLDQAIKYIKEKGNSFVDAEIAQLKGSIKMSQKNHKQAIVFFEQAITLNTCHETTNLCLKNIVLIKIWEKDIYAALYTLERLQPIPENLLFLSHLMEGAVFIIKRKFQEGISLIEQTISKISDTPISKDTQRKLEDIALSYRAYANFSNGKISEALEDYQTLRDSGNISQGDIYNKELCHGVIHTQKKNFTRAEHHFRKAERMGISEIEPVFYQAFLIIIRFLSENSEEYKQYLRDRSINSESQTSQPLKPFEKKLQKEVKKSINLLQSVIPKNDSNANLSFYLGYLKLLEGLDEEAIEHFNFAMEKSDDNYTHHFLWKGIAYAMGGAYDQALNEFRISCSIDPTYYPAALYTGRCYLHSRNIEAAFNCFQEFMNGADQECEIKYWVANFFFVINFNSHSDQFYQEAFSINESEQLLSQMYKNHIVEKDLIKALDKLQELKSSHPDPRYYTDYKVLEALKRTSVGEYKESLGDLLELLEGMESEGLIFKSGDILFYTGFCYFYVEEYSKAYAFFRKAREVKYSSKSAADYHESETVEQMFVQDESVMDEDEENQDPIYGQSFTMAEVLYNMAISISKTGDLTQAALLFEQAAAEHPKLEGPCKQLARALSGNDDAISSLLSKIEVSEVDKSSRGLMSDSKDQADEEDQEEEKLFLVFPYKRRLCGIYPTIDLPLLSETTQQLSSIPLKLSFCLPYVKPPSLKIKVGYEILRNIKITTVENRPEAPWIKRSNEGIMFTSELTSTEITEVKNLDQLFKHMAANNSQSVMNTNVRIKAENLFRKKASEKDISDKNDGDGKYQLLVDSLKLDDTVTQRLNNIIPQFLIQ